MNADLSFKSTGYWPLLIRRWPGLPVALIASVLVALVCLWLLALPPGTAHAAPEACVPGPHSGTITTSQEWCASDNPHVVNGSISVATGVTLTVEAGVEVRFNSGTHLEVYDGGTLLATGTPAQPIVFTANQVSPTPGSWRYLYFLGGSHASLAYCDLAYAGQTNGVALYVDSSDVQLAHCNIHDNLGDAIQVVGTGLAPTLSDLIIAGNSGRAVYQNTVDMTPQYSNLSVSGNGTNAIVSESGNFGRNATIAIAGTVDGGTLPYIWLGPVDVSSSYTLTIDLGVELRFASGFDLEIQPSATLVAEGTPSQPITFTTTVSPAIPGSWRYFLFHSGSNASLAFCNVGYAGQLNYAALYVDSSAVQVEFCRLHQNLGAGLQVRSNAQPRLAYNRIEDNGFGLRNENPATQVDARHNWWGDATGPYHATLNPSGLGNAVSDGVLFDPWLEPYAYFWREPQQFLLHGSETLAWYEFAALQPAAHSVDILAATTGQQSTLGTGLPRSGELTWDTTAHPDGLYELHALFRDASNQIVAHIVREVAINNNSAVAWHSGRLAANESWGPGVVHVVDEDLIVPGGITLTVQAGAVVKFEKGVGVTVEDGGVLDIQATGGASVILTSLADDTVGGDTNLDGSNSIPLPGDWAGITVQGAGQADLNEFVDLRYVLATHAGTLPGSETWADTFVHRITGDVIVPAGGTLTIEPGAVVKFDPGKSLIVNAGATLLAEGEVARPIVFTSIRDDSAGGDSNHDGDATAPAPGDWYRIYLDGSTVSLDHVQLRYGAGTDSVHGALVHTNGAANLTIANSVLSDGLYTGLLAWDGPVTIDNSLITANDRGISAHPGSTVNVVNCTVDDNRINLLIHGGTLNTANTLVTHHLESGFQYDFGAVGTLRYNDAWSPVAGAVNYRNMADQTGTNGNVSTDPHYKDREGRSYRLQYLSPAIDAADGGLAPETDFMGAPRYDDPRTPNTGLPTPGGGYADLGAYEFVETANSNIDLVVSQVQGPLSALAGEVVSLTWTVVNRGSEGAVGPWHDVVALVYSPTLSPTVLLAGEVLVGQGVALGPGQSHQAWGQIRVPGGVEASYHWQVETNSRSEVFEGQNRANNSSSSLAAVALAVPELVVDAPPLARQFGAEGEAHWFKVMTPAEQDVLLSLVSQDTGNVVDLYAGLGTIPSWQSYDLRQNEDNTASPSVFVPAGPAATYYLLADPRAIPGSGQYTIRARQLVFELASVSPTQVGNVGYATLELRGGQLEPDTVFGLVAPDGSVITSPMVFSLDGTLVRVTFDLTGQPPGWYDVQVTGPAGTATLADAVQVVQGVPPRLWMTLVGPPKVRVYDDFTYQVYYGNAGNVDASISLLDFYSPKDSLALLGFMDPSTFPRLFETRTRDDVTWSAAHLGPGAHAALTACLYCPVEGPNRLDSRGVAVPYDRSDAKSRADPTTTVSHEILVATTEYFQGVTHFVADDGAADISFEMHLSDTPGAITPTLLYTDDGVYETVYVEVSPPAGWMEAAGSGVQGSVSAQPKTVRAKIKLPKPDPGKIYDWYERCKDWVDSLLHVQQKKAERDFRKDLAECLYEAGFITEAQRDAAIQRAQGEWVGIIGIQALKEIVDLAPGIGDYYAAQLDVASSALTKDDRWLTELWNQVRAGAVPDGQGHYWLKSADGKREIDVDAGFYQGDLEQVLINMATDDDIQPCLERLCQAGVEGSCCSQPLRCLDDGGGENEMCELLSAEDTTHMECVKSHDPNDKYGPLGAGPERFIAPWDGLGYGISFENMVTATAPAQTVVLTDHLHGSRVDLSTFELGPMTFGQTTVTPPAGRTAFSTLVDLRPVQDLWVQIDAALEPATGLVTWRFTSIDPATKALPEDPLLGFLPPNANPPEGQGYVYYTLRSVPGLSHGTEIRNRASIVFDQNEPILTPERVNTIDAEAPTSAVEPLPALSPPNFALSWDGDDGNGSGIAWVDLYVAQDEGAFVLWQAGITQTQVSFAGQPGHSYGFYSVATDRVGWRQPTPAGAQASTTIQTEALGIPVLLSPANDTVTTTQALTFSWAAGTGATPDGYNLDLDGAVITTTAQSWATVLPLGIHTWTVRAYNGGGYSAWASPAWTVEIVSSRHYIYLPLVLRSHP